MRRTLPERGGGPTRGRGVTRTVGNTAPAAKNGPAGAAASGPLRPPSPGVVARDTPESCRWALRLICHRPEIRPLCPEVRFAVDPGLPGPFRVAGGARIVLHPDALASPAGALLLVRHALELALWQRLTAGEPALGRPPDAGLLIARVAARYAALLPAADRRAIADALPTWLATAYAFAGADDLPSRRHMPQAAAVLADLDRLDGDGAGAAGIDRFDRLEAVAAPVEWLLVTGGGSRLDLDPQTGRNPYGCDPRPCPEVLAFGSATAATISAPAYAAAEVLRQRLLLAALQGALSTALATTLDDLRRRILGAAGVADLAGIEAVLVPSGTDGEYAALHIARRRAIEPLVNLVIAPEETGSGVAAAAAGRHFAPRPPRGAPVGPGEPLAGIRPELIRVETVAIRDPDGRPRSAAAIDEEVEAEVTRALAAGARCLVHRLEGSKSGLVAPGSTLIERLTERHGERLEVLVDACQLRLGAAELRRHLERGRMVLVTGSKFAMGPPFAGALLVPARLAEYAATLAPLPAGFAAYFGRPEWPERFATVAATLPGAANLGLICRWQAALFEIETFARIPEADRLELMAALGEGIRGALTTAPLLEPLAADRSEPGWPSTIFPFRIRCWPDDRGTFLPFEETQKVWRWLREDLGDRLPEDLPRPMRRLAGLPCQVGQPIKAGTQNGIATGALRICIGAHLITQIAFDRALGESVAVRLRRQIGRARMVIDKTLLIARNYDRLTAAGPAA